MTTDWPRRRRIDLNSQAELKIREAIKAVEHLGADPVLTSAVVLLDQAFEKVADYVDVEMGETVGLAERVINTPFEKLRKGLQNVVRGNREERAINLIREERRYQDEKWGTIDERPHTPGEWLLILEGELQEAKEAWIKVQGYQALLSEVRQVGAVALACMEQHGAPSRLDEQKKGSNG